MRLSDLCRFSLLCLLLAGLCGAAPVARAQEPGPVVVRVSPALTQVAAGGEVDVAVEVVEVTALYGADVSLAFDPNAVEVVDVDPGASGVQVAQGTFLDPGFAILNAADNTTGKIRWAMTQLNPSVAKSGTGSLIVVRLRGKQAGLRSALTLADAQLAQPDGTLLKTSLSSGEVEVVAALSGPTPTPMPTQGAAIPIATLQSLLTPAGTEAGATQPAAAANVAATARAGTARATPVATTPRAASSGSQVVLLAVVGGGVVLALIVVFVLARARRRT